MSERAIVERARRAVEEGVFPGCVVGAVYRDGRRMALPFGALTYERGAPEVRAATVYDLASVTKSIPLASLALAFIAEGKFGLDDRAIDFLPELKNDHGATIEDLLLYRVHGTRLSALRRHACEEIRARVLECGFDAPPGEPIYTNLPAFVLGMIVEHVGGRSLASLARSYFFDPLGMRSTTFFPSADDCAPTEIDERGEVRGLPHDESAYQCALERHAAGHAGLFSTAPDLLDFLDALLRGEFPYIIDGARRGLGWQTGGDFLGHYADTGAFGKTGFTGTSVCVDYRRGIAFVMLSNRTYPKRPADNTAITAFRADIADIFLDVVK